MVKFSHSRSLIKCDRSNLLCRGEYIFGYEPPSSVGYNYYDSTLKAYAPGV